MSLRDLDALYAERVLRETVKWSGDVPLLPCYTQSLDAAWTGVEKRLERNPDFTLGHDRDKTWYAIFGVDGDTDQDTVWSEMQATPALALVKAALLASGVTQDEIDNALDSDG